jgi:guanylate kinase
MNILIIGNKYTGKTVLENELQRLYQFDKIISYTTRKPRPLEVDGVDYHFITLDNFINKSIDNDFIESVNNYDNWYGIAKEDLLNNDDNVLVVERKGLAQILENSDRDNYFIVKLTCDFNEK